jgi:putative membrane protein
MWWYNNFMDGWDYAIMAINMVLFWGLIILGLIGLFRYLANGDRSTPSQDAPEQVLAERFARSEIDEQELHQRLDAQRGTPGPASRIESTRTLDGSAEPPSVGEATRPAVHPMPRVAPAMSRQDGSFGEEQPGEEQPFGQLDQD